MPGCCSRLSTLALTLTASYSSVATQTMSSFMAARPVRDPSPFISSPTAASTRIYSAAGSGSPSSSLRSRTCRNWNGSSPRSSTTRSARTRPAPWSACEAKMQKPCKRPTTRRLSRDGQIYRCPFSTGRRALMDSYSKIGPTRCLRMESLSTCPLCLETTMTVSFYPSHQH